MIILILIFIAVIIILVVKSNNSDKSYTYNTSNSSSKINTAIGFKNACNYLDKAHSILNKLDKNRFEISNDEYKNEYYYAAYMYQLGFVYKVSLLGYPITTKILAPNIGLQRVTIDEATSISKMEFIRISENYKYKNNMQSDLFDNIMNPEFMIDFEQKLPLHKRI
ncbi:MULTISPECIES: hypothetical protein [Empedobacter]|uniref:Uncharacterized protein n=1 Tax=Empedobacter falsenii TaxID=343874 RepID=A0A3R8SL39_9FLAO|nr:MULTISPECIES: hypothetical protein [Empedobacter]MDH0660424.1 hypothetical protein [Empedobacter sp. GD03865]MDH0674873.1 hypothetical protein [Empedobacter sp. GD03861]MDH1603110.1 hypothetical protein [Empedobacter sp. GD03739]RRT89987.1 hypothetical protein EGI89_10340 [Empedobacter falsenii]RRT90031.1 hypothetical protein EGI88_10270 [Empedobacter falsenii]